jgi:hypothetical protein
VSQFEGILDADAVVVDVVVAPGWGIFGFLFGTIGSLVTNHFMLYWSDSAIEADERFADKLAGVYVEETPTAKVPASKHKFNAADAKGRLYGWTPATRLGVTATLGISSLLIVIGSALPLILFEFQGLAGTAISLIDQDLASVEYSPFTLAIAITNGLATDFTTQIGVLFLQIVFLAFAVFTPLALNIVFLVLWLVPLRLREQKKLFFASKILAAWEALLILIVSVVAAILQISDLAQFIVKNSTGTICLTIEQNFGEKCFDVEASLLPSGGILIAGSFLQVIISIISFRMIGSVVTDRYKANKRKECVSPPMRRGINPIGRNIWVRSFTVPVARINLHGNGAAVATSVPGASDVEGREMKNPLFPGAASMMGSMRPDIDV